MELVRECFGNRVNFRGENRVDFRAKGGLNRRRGRSKREGTKRAVAGKNRLEIRRGVVYSTKNA